MRRKFSELFCADSELQEKERIFCNEAILFLNELYLYQ